MNKDISIFNEFSKQLCKNESDIQKAVYSFFMANYWDHYGNNNFSLCDDRIALHEKLTNIFIDNPEYVLSRKYRDNYWNTIYLDLKADHLYRIPDKTLKKVALKLSKIELKELEKMFELFRQIFYGIKQGWEGSSSKHDWNYHWDSHVHIMSVLISSYLYVFHKFKFVFKNDYYSIFSNDKIIFKYSKKILKIINEIDTYVFPLFINKVAFEKDFNLKLIGHPAAFEHYRLYLQNEYGKNV